MNKKRYMQPTAKVVELELSEIIANSRDRAVQLIQEEADEADESSITGFGKQW